MQAQENSLVCLVLSHSGTLKLDGFTVFAAMAGWNLANLVEGQTFHHNTPPPPRTTPATKKI